MTNPNAKVIKVINELTKEEIEAPNASEIFYEKIKGFFTSNTTLINNYNRARPILIPLGLSLVKFWQISKETEEIARTVRNLKTEQAATNFDNPQGFKRSIINKILNVADPLNMGLDDLAYYIMAVSGRRLVDLMGDWREKDGKVFYVPAKNPNKTEVEFEPELLMPNTVTLDVFYQMIQRFKLLVEDRKYDQPLDRVQRRLSRFAIGSGYFKPSDLRDTYTLIMTSNETTPAQKVLKAQDILKHKQITSSLFYVRNSIDEDVELPEVKQPVKPEGEVNCQVCGKKFMKKNKRRHERTAFHIRAARAAEGERRA